VRRRNEVDRLARAAFAPEAPFG